jgi:hypothetical protein
LSADCQIYVTSSYIAIDKRRRLEHVRGILQNVDKLETNQLQSIGTLSA